MKNCYAGVAQWQSEGLIIPRPWVRFPPPAPEVSQNGDLDSLRPLDPLKSNRQLAQFRASPRPHASSLWNRRRATYGENDLFVVRKEFALLYFS